jgi:hypothetical protein
MPTWEGRPPPWLSFISLRFRLAIASFLSTSFFKILFFIFYLLLVFSPIFILTVTLLADTYLTQIRTKIPLFCEKKLSLVNQKLLLEGKEEREGKEPGKLLSKTKKNPRINLFFLLFALNFLVYVV